MRKRNHSRRDVLLASLKARPRWRWDGVRRPRARRGAAAGRDHTATGRGRQERGNVILYSSMTCRSAKNSQGIRGGLSRHLRADRALRLGAAVPAAGPGIREQHPRADIVNSSDASHFISWKKSGWLAPFVTEDIAQHFLPEYRDPDGLHATTRIWLSSIAYNTHLVKAEDAPKSFADLLDRNGPARCQGHPPIAAPS